MIALLPVQCSAAQVTRGQAVVLLVLVVLPLVLVLPLLPHLMVTLLAMLLQPPESRQPGQEVSLQPEGQEPGGGKIY